MTECKIYVTDIHGNGATVQGEAETVQVIINALEAAGAAYNDHVDCYDFGFYEDTKVNLAMMVDEKALLHVQQGYDYNPSMQLAVKAIIETYEVAKKSARNVA